MLSVLKRELRQYFHTPVGYVFLAIFWLLGAVFFVATFVIYFFNLDMKATAMLEPFFAKHYDAMQRNQYI